MTNYTYAQLSDIDFGWARVGGAGLGNILYPWMRSVVDASRYGHKPLFPAWTQLKVGPWIRGEIDARAYYDLFTKNEMYASSLEKAKALLLSNKIEEDNANHDRDDRNVTIVYSGVRSYFQGYERRHSKVKDFLLDITKNKHLKNVGDTKGSICVHVRLGDFKKPKDSDVLLTGPGPYRLPFKWYKTKIKQVRQRLGKTVPVNIFSNGKDEELRPLLSLENTSRQYQGSSLADLHALSNASVLIASGSSFSFWASYLGRMPVIWYPTQLFHSIYVEQPALEIESGEQECPPNQFVDAAREKICEA
jgi:hypothetical protein